MIDLSAVHPPQPLPARARAAARARLPGKVVSRDAVRTRDGVRLLGAAEFTASASENSGPQPAAPGPADLDLLTLRAAAQLAATRTRRPNRAAFFPVTMTNRLWWL